MTHVTDTFAEQLPVGMLRCPRCMEVIHGQFITSHDARDCKGREDRESTADKQDGVWQRHLEVTQ